MIQMAVLGFGTVGGGVVEVIDRNQDVIRKTVPQGIYVKGIESDSPAMQAGIQNGDIVVSVDGETVKTLYGLGKVVAKYKVGDQVKVVVQRQGSEEYVEVPFDVTIGSKE